MSRKSIAVSAIAGSFTEETTRTYLSDTDQTADFKCVGTARNAFEQVATGKADLGIIPIRNSNAGFVLENLQASADFTYTIEHVFSLSVRQNLLVQPGTSASKIANITSQLPALAECGVYQDNHWSHATQTEYIDTALAARDLSEGKLKSTTAVIASRTAAKLYKLEILAADTQTDRLNYTDFMIITKHKH
ncbi:MAG TPA: prephenate dehydratase domain-containing protein [Candidatus Saccharimonadia bacterium]|nr:prephenate dehydratase domain-containing protein [Candidatus Saccharimonadia bacterium]